jgi:hypothetical protein
MTKMAQRQALVTIEGLEGLWATKTGGNVSADTTPVWDGGTDHPDVLASPASAENVTVSRPVDDVRDLALIKTLRHQVGKLRATITEQPTNGDLFPIGEPDVYPAALLVTLNVPEYDASSGDPKVIELEWAISQFV